MVCQVESYQNVLKLSCRSLAFISYKSVFKKKRSGTILSVSFCMIFKEKYFSCYILLTD